MERRQVMEFNLLSVHVWRRDQVYSFSLCSVAIGDGRTRGLLGIWWDQEELLVDLFWFRVIRR